MANFRKELSAKPLLGLTMGDPAGIGPEIVLKALMREEVAALADFVVFGSPAVLSERAQRFGLPCNLQIVNQQAPPTRTDLPALALIDFGCPTSGELKLGESAGECGRAAIEYVESATDWALKGTIDALVTAPINKESVALADLPYAGHTELLAQKTGAQRVVMMLVMGDLRVALVTRHLALREVPAALTTEKVYQTIEVMAGGLKRYFGIREPRLGVCALNPHASDGGRFGDEEQLIITPAIHKAREAGINCEGPVPGDVIFHQALGGAFDAVVAMYHDQGLIPIKTVGFGRAVNVTLGLPIIRTSVDHGTAFDIVEKGTASPGSLTAAIQLACQMVKYREEER